MADNERENTFGFVDKRRATVAGERNRSTTLLATPANYADVSALRARLTAFQPGTYTADRLNRMTKNDMVYAVRQADDAAGIK